MCVCVYIKADINKLICLHVHKSIHVTFKKMVPGINILQMKLNFKKTDLRLDKRNDT